MYPLLAPVSEIPLRRENISAYTTRMLFIKRAIVRLMEMSELVTHGGSEK